MKARALWSAAAFVALAGCGIDPQSAPEDVSISPIPAATTQPTATTPGPQLALWFLREDRLASVTRAAADDTPQTALQLLAEGPAPGEADDGYTTAVAGQPLAVASTGDPAGDVLTVEVGPAFSGVVGDDQLRAVAQVVWTVTEFGGIDAVRFTTGDEPLEVPTDQGLSDQPVDRDDYASLAPTGGSAGS